MSSPIYTATSGPADPGAGTRAKLYSGLAVLTPLLSALATFGVISSDQSNALVGFVTAGVGLLSAFGFGLAATKTNHQLKDGTFDPAPPPVLVAPVDNALEQLTTLQSAVNDQVDKAQARVADGITFIQAAASMIPGGAPGRPGDLLAGLSDLTNAMRGRPAPETPKHLADK